MKFQFSLLGKIAVAPAVVPALLLANSGGAIPGRSGAPGELTCVACHQTNPLNSGPGKIEILFSQDTGYTPGATYRMRVVLDDPTARRWGFQLSARAAADNRSVGTLRPAPDGFTQVVQSEWITHTAIGTRPGTQGPTTFEFDWIAPNEDVGDVVFYAAGNAANNNNNNQGDQIYSTSKRISLASVGATPTLRSELPVLQAFDDQPRISPGTWIQLFGNNFAQTGPRGREWAESDFNGNTAPTNLDGWGVLIDDVPAYVRYISPNQINVQVPNINPTGTATIVVTGPGVVRSAPFTLPKAEVSPAILAPPNFKVGDVQYAAANFPDLVTFVGPPDLVQNVPFRPAKPGDLIIFYAVGCGPTIPDVPPGQIAPDLDQLARPVEIKLGGETVTPSYAGHYPGFIGLYRFDITVPNLPDGDHKLELSVGGVSTGQELFLTVQN